MADLPPNLFFASCSDLIDFFNDGRVYFNESYVKKLPVLSRYWNDIDTQMWPLNTAYEQEGFRFGRGWYQEDQPWYQVEGACGDDTCDAHFEQIEMPGVDTYTWQVLRKEMTSPIWCATKLLGKLFPAEQVMQIEDTNQIITRNVHQSFIRAFYYGGAGYHWLATVDDSGTYCGQFQEDGWYLGTFSGADQGGYNLQYVYVNKDPNDLANIAILGLDVLDDILQVLQLEDDAYRLDIYEATGAQLLDILIPDPLTARKLYFQAKNSAGNWNSESGYDNDLKELKMNIKHVISDYAFSYDITAPRYNVDYAYNADLPSYDSSDPTTWPRLVRVPQYRKVAATKGCKWVPTAEYRNADFAISVPWVPKSITKWMYPAVAGYGSMQASTPNFAGDWSAIELPWSECNRLMNQVVFQAQFRAAAQIKDPTLIHPILHRLPKGKNPIGECCPLNTYTVPGDDTDCYQCQPAS